MLHPDVLGNVEQSSSDHKSAIEKVQLCYSDDQWTNLFGSTTIAKELMQVRVSLFLIYLNSLTVYG